jgi:hypothetical protein
MTPGLRVCKPHGMQSSFREPANAELFFPSRHHLKLVAPIQRRAESVHHRTLQDVITLFSSTAQPCIIDQIGCIVIFHQIVRGVGAHGAGTRGSMRSAHNDACFTWLTRPRSGQELLELVQSQCTCGPMAMGMSHHQVGLAVMSDRAGNTPSEPFFLLAEFILLFFLCRS